MVQLLCKVFTFFHLYKFLNKTIKGCKIIEPIVHLDGYSQLMPETSNKEWLQVLHANKEQPFL